MAETTIVSKKINLFILILAAGLPLFNGGKDFGAFWVTTILLCGSGLWVLSQQRQGGRITIPVAPHFNTLAGCFYGLVFLNIFFTVYIYATVIEWIRITGYFIFYLLLSLSAGCDRKAFTSLGRNMLFLAIFISLVEAIIIIVQSFMHLPPRGTMPNENVAASYILIGLMAAISYLFFSSGASRRKKALGIVSVLLLSAALALSRSRGVLIALLVACGALSKLKFKKWGVISVFLTVLGILAFFPVPVFDAVFKINIPYSYRRLYIWQSAWEIMKDHPWFGWGLGNFGLAFPRYNLPSLDTVLRFGKVTRFAHNEFLQVATEMGLPAMILYGAIIGYIIKTGWPLSRQKNITWTHAAAYASFIGIIVHSLVDFNLHLPGITFMAIMLGTILLLDTSLVQDRTYIFPGTARKAVTLFLSSVLVINILFIVGHIYLSRAEKGEAEKAPAAAIVKAYRKAQFFNPLNSYYHEKLARFYAGQYQQENNLLAGELAISEYTQASRLNPEEASFYEELFYLYYALGSPLPNMEQNYVQVMARNPHLFKPTLVLAVFHMQRRNFWRAIQLLSDVTKEEPNYLTAYYYLAKAYESLGALGSAREQYEIIVRKSDQHLEKIAQSNYELEALKVPQMEVFTRLGILYSQERRYPQAVSLLNRALVLAPHQPEILNALAGAYFGQEKYQTALPYAREAVCLAPQNKEFKQNLGLCLQKISTPGKP